MFAKAVVVACKYLHPRLDSILTLAIRLWCLHEVGEGDGGHGEAYAFGSFVSLVRRLCLQSVGSHTLCDWERVQSRRRPGIVSLDGPVEDMIRSYASDVYASRVDSQEDVEHSCLATRSVSHPLKVIARARRLPTPAARAALFVPSSAYVATFDVSVALSCKGVSTYDCGFDGQTYATSHDTEQH